MQYDRKLPHAETHNLAGVCHLHVMNGLGNPLEGKLKLNLVLKGISRIKLCPSCLRLPVTPLIMKAIGTAHPGYESTMLWAACCVGFFGFLRYSAVGYDNRRHLSVSDVSVDSHTNRHPSQGYQNRSTWGRHHSSLGPNSDQHLPSQCGTAVPCKTCRGWPSLHHAPRNPSHKGHICQEGYRDSRANGDRCLPLQGTFLQYQCNNHSSCMWSERRAHQVTRPVGKLGIPIMHQNSHRPGEHFSPPPPPPPPPPYGHCTF